MSFDPAARRRSGGGGVKSQSSFYKEDRRRQAGTAPYLLKDGRSGGRRPSQDTDEGRRQRSRSNSPHGYDRRHHFGGRHEQSPGRNRSRNYGQHAYSRGDQRASSNHSYDEQSSGSARSRSYDRHADRYGYSNQSRDEGYSGQGRRRSRSRSRDRYSMGTSRFKDYADINVPKIPRSCDEDGKAPARIVLCFMARLTHLGSSSEAKNYPLRNLRNRCGEEVEGVWLKILFETIEGHGMYGDVRSMSAKELSKRWWYLYEKYGWSVFGWDSATWSEKLGCMGGKSGKAKKSGQKGKPHQTSGDGASKCFLDPADPSRHATFCFTYKKDGSKAEGSLKWLVDRRNAKEKGRVSYYLVDGGSKAVDRLKPIYCISPDGDKVDVSDDIEDRYPKPTPWVCIEGIEKKYSESDVKDELRRGLQGGTESDDAGGVGIVDIQRWNDGRLFVKFGKVWDARGCEFVLDDTKKLFGGDGIAVSRVLENDLPDTLKMSEARKRDEVSAAKKAAESKSPMDVETEE